MLRYIHFHGKQVVVNRYNPRNHGNYTPRPELAQKMLRLASQQDPCPLTQVAYDGNIHLTYDCRKEANP